jgi:hypothetical protein
LPPFSSQTPARQKRSRNAKPRFLGRGSGSG